MNEQIKKLMTQASEVRVSGFGETEILDPEKFALLIIQETLGVVCNVRMNARAAFEVSNRTDLDKFIGEGSTACMIDAVNDYFGIKQ